MHTTALQVPISSVVGDNSVIGVYASAYRFKNRIFNANGTVSNTGKLQQISRLGMPLTNEVLIPLDDKDA